MTIHTLVVFKDQRTFNSRATFEDAEAEACNQWQRRFKQIYGKNLIFPLCSPEGEWYEEGSQLAWTSPTWAERKKGM